MNYFEQFNIVNINDKKLRDLFFKVYVDTIEENHLINYELRDYETIKDVAHTFYSEVNLWWVIALLNNVYDINYDWVLTNEQIEAVALEKATDEYGDVIKSDYLSYYDELRTSSDSKRIIKLLKPEFLTNFIDIFLNEKIENKDEDNEDTILEEYSDNLLDDINYKIIKGTLFDVSLPLCNNSDIYVYNVKVLNVLSNITLSWDLPPNNSDYQGIWIVDNDVSIALINPTSRAYTIQNADIGDHEIHIILVQKSKGESISCDIFVALPSISVEVDKTYFETLNMNIVPSVTGGYGSITWECLENSDNLVFETNTPELSGVLLETETQRVTFIATDSAGRFDRKRVDIIVNRFPELTYDIENEYDQFDIFLLEPILTYGYGVRTYTVDSLPSGLTMNASGVISGQVLEYGTFNITVSMVDEKNRGTSYSFTLEINEVPPVTISLTLETDYTRTKAISIIPSVIS